MTNAFEKQVSGHDDHWIPLSDLMTGLMMIFLLIAISYMIKGRGRLESHKGVQRKNKRSRHAL
jgi:hypothetical protein